MKNEQQFYNELKKRLEFLLTNPERDNESSRHDLLIYPLITSEFGLKWNPIDLISQNNISVPKQIKDSHIFRGAIPKIRKPDLLICPNEIIKNIAVIEEKAKQDNLASLLNHRIQLAEYQAIYETNWGVLTDGEKWVLKRGFETLLEFESLSELQKGIKDFRNYIGKIEILNRLNKSGLLDLVIVTPSNLISENNFTEFENIPVVICGIENSIITDNGIGFKNYRNLKEALVEFPDLHPKMHSNRFTWAMPEFDKTGKKILKLRFETWKANEMYSA